MRHPALRRVGGRSAEIFGVDLLMGHGLHHVRSGHEHVARVLDHDREVRDRRRIDRAARARPHHDRDLGNDAGGQDVAQEDLGVPAEGCDALLDPSAARIVEADDRSADLHRQVHDLADLLGVGLRERSPEDREVLAEDEDEPAVDRAVAGHDTVAQHVVLGETEFGGSMGDEGIELDERARIEQEIEPLPGRQLAPGVLTLDPYGPATEQRLGPHLIEPAQSLIIRRHRGRTSRCPCAKTEMIIVAHIEPARTAPAGHEAGRVPDARSDIHRFGEQLAKRVDNRGARTGV